MEIEVLQEGTSLTNSKISKDFTKNTATQAMTSLLSMDTFSGPSMQCHICYQCSCTWTALLWDSPKAGSTLPMGAFTPAFPQPPAPRCCPCPCSCHRRTAGLPASLFTCWAKADCWPDELNQTLPLSSGISFCLPSASFLEATEHCSPLQPLVPRHAWLPGTVCATALTACRCDQSHHYRCVSTSCTSHTAWVPPNPTAPWKLAPSKGLGSSPAQVGNTTSPDTQGTS